MSICDMLSLSGCYVAAAAYLAVALRRLRAVKSRIGLVITVLTQVWMVLRVPSIFSLTGAHQVCTSIMSSFTILAILKIPVSHVPR